MMFLAGRSFCDAAPFLPEHPSSYVVDVTHTLSADEKSALEQKLIALHKDGKVEMYVVMIDSLNDEPINEYTMDLATRWKAGKKDVDNGLILLIAKDDKKMRMEIGRGLEGAITDGMAGEAIDSMKPYFKRGKYFYGINACIDVTETFLDHSEAPQEKNTSTNIPLQKIIYALASIFIIELILFCIVWTCEASDRKEQYENSFTKALFAWSVFSAAVVYTITSSIDFLGNIFGIIGNFLGGGNNNDGDSSSGSFDGGGSDDDW